MLFGDASGIHSSCTPPFRQRSAVDIMMADRYTSCMVVMLIGMDGYAGDMFSDIIIH